MERRKDLSSHIRERQSDSDNAAGVIEGDKAVVGMMQAFGDRAQESFEKNLCNARMRLAQRTIRGKGKRERRKIVERLAALGVERTLVRESLLAAKVALMQGGEDFRLVAEFFVD